MNGRYIGIGPKKAISVDLYSLSHSQYVIIVIVVVAGSPIIIIR